MNPISFRQRIIAVLAIALPVIGNAQFATTSPAGIDAALAKLFGEVKAFTAQAEVEVYGAGEHLMMSTPMTFALLTNKIRVEVDITRLKNKDLPAGTMESMKQMGMDKIYSIMRPDRKTSYIVYPGLKSYLAQPMSRDDPDWSNDALKVDRKVIGKETLDGQACVKHLVTISDVQGNQQEATTWNDPKLRNFPIQIQIANEEHQATIRFRDVKFAQPHATLFEMPKGYTAYDNPQELVQGAVRNMMNSLEDQLELDQ